MKTCAYISGSPCVGKTTVAMAVQRLIPGIEHIRGDDYWRKHPNLPFEERVAKVNQRILASLRNATSSDILCEWVPCRGLFVAQLHDVCMSLNRKFLHVILTASVSVLRSRKQERDGDEDIGPGVATYPDTQEIYECLMFDTAQVETSCISNEISRWILCNRELNLTA